MSADDFTRSSLSPPRRRKVLLARWRDDGIERDRPRSTGRRNGVDKAGRLVRTDTEWLLTQWFNLRIRSIAASGDLFSERQVKPGT